MRLLYCLILAICFGQAAVASIVHKTLYINRGEIDAIDSSQFSYLAFNETSAFHQNNVLIRIATGDSLILKVVNNDSLGHIFSCKAQASNLLVLNPGDTGIYKYQFNSRGVYIYSVINPLMAYLGLGGMISVENNTNPHFFWNIKEHNKKWNDSISKGHTVNWSDYYPDYFLINGNSNPEINNDSVARVVGNVGDTIYIAIANTGRSIHSLHFHGYHGEIIFSSRFPQHHGRSKDTFPIDPGHALIIKIIPDKPGEYPVHDHNLVAVSGGNYYPNGMFLTMLIQ